MKALMNSKRRKAENRAHWQSVIDDWQASGLGPTVYCRKMTIKESSFYKWKRDFAAAGAGLALATTELPRFVAVPAAVLGADTGLRKPARADGAVVVHIGDRCRIRITGPQSAALLERAISALVRLA